MIERILQKKYQDFLALVDIEINGERPWDLQIHTSKLFTKVLSKSKQYLLDLILILLSKDILG